MREAIDAVPTDMSRLRSMVGCAVVLGILRIWDDAVKLSKEILMQLHKL